MNAPIIPAAVDSAGALEVPANVFQAAWFQAGNAPGQPGTAIIAAHVDFRARSDSSTACTPSPRGGDLRDRRERPRARRFTSLPGRLAAKSDPSTVQSLAAASATPGQPRLALITCGGDLNYAKHSYYDNFVLLADG